MKRIDILKENLMRNINYLCCPICGSNFNAENYSLVCKNRHTFDLSTKGYVNFLTKNIHSGYSEKLFDSRREVFAHGFFNMMLDALADITGGIADMKNTGLILDAGCGEGSALRRIISGLSSDGLVPVGLDISRDAIINAASGNTGRASDDLWFTGSISSMPIKDRAVKVLLNILSPADYAEFKRVCSDTIIKVIPGQDYLREIRNYFFDGDNENSLRVMEHFKNNINTVSVMNIKYTYPVDTLILSKTLEMTPLCWNAPEDKKRGFLEEGVSELTADFIILTGSA